MKVALIFNPFAYKLHEENLRIVQRYFGLFPPLSLGWVAAIAERAGHEVEIIDARTLQLPPAQVLAHLKKWKPDVLGFMMTTYMFRETLDWIRYLRGGLDGKAKVMVGGYNLRVYPIESVTAPEIDFGCFNSAYETVPRLLEELEGGQRFDDVPGLIWRRDGQWQRNPAAWASLDDLPPMSRRWVDNRRYFREGGQAGIETKRGCPRHCTYCADPVAKGKRTRVRHRRLWPANWRISCTSPLTISTLATASSISPPGTRSRYARRS